MSDPINPHHYKDHQSGVECITISRHHSFNIGNTFKYLWRAGKKGDLLEDLKKAAWYLNDEIEKIENERPQNTKPFYIKEKEVDGNRKLRSNKTRPAILRAKQK